MFTTSNQIGRKRSLPVLFISLNIHYMGSFCVPLETKWWPYNVKSPLRKSRTIYSFISSRQDIKHGPFILVQKIVLDFQPDNKNISPKILWRKNFGHTISLSWFQTIMLRLQVNNSVMQQIPCFVQKEVFIAIQICNYCNCKFFTSGPISIS